RLARDRLGLALEQVLHEHGRLVARSARPAGRIAALAFLKLHNLGLLCCDEKNRNARHAYAARSSTRFRERGDEHSPRHFRPVFLRSSGEYKIYERFHYAQSSILSRRCVLTAPAQ